MTDEAKKVYLLIREFDTDKIIRKIDVTGENVEEVECRVMRNMQLEHYYTEIKEIK